MASDVQSFGFREGLGLSKQIILISWRYNDFPNEEIPNKDFPNYIIPNQDKSQAYVADFGQVKLGSIGPSLPNLTLPNPAS